MQKERGFIGGMFKWMWILFNLFMLVLVYLTQIATQESNGFVETVGSMGIGMFIAMWVMGNMVLGGFTYFTRAK